MSIINRIFKYEDGCFVYRFKGILTIGNTIYSTKVRVKVRSNSRTQHVSIVVTDQNKEDLVITGSKIKNRSITRFYDFTGLINIFKDNPFINQNKTIVEQIIEHLGLNAMRFNLRK